MYCTSFRNNYLQMYFFQTFAIVAMFVNVTPLHLDCSEFVFFLLFINLYVLYFLLNKVFLALYLVSDLSKKILLERSLERIT